MSINSNCEISELLRNWGYDEVVVNKFKDENIQIKHLAFITEFSLEKLFPKIGLRMDFMEKIKTYKLNEKNLNRKRKHDTSDIESIASTSSTPVCNLSLEEVLQSAEGKIIKSYYDTERNFNEYYRIKLADEIIRQELRFDVAKNLPNHVIEYWTDQITLTFGNESYEVWAGHTKGRFRDSSAGRGLLLTRYYNMRRKLHKSGVLTKTLKMTAKETLDVSDCEQEDLLLWLKNNTASVNLVLENWQLTTSARLSAFIKTNKEIHDYINEYAALKCADGYRLLQVDFKNLYEDADMQLYVEWPTLTAFLLGKISEKDKYEIDNCFTSDGKKVKTIRSLTSLFGVKNIIMKKRKQWRPSKMESRDALIQYVKDISDIQVEINKTKKKFLELSLNYGPQLFAVSPDKDNIKGYCIVINQLLYNIENFLQAFDIYFKIFHALHCQYPKASEREMLFIQCAVYGIKCESDKNVFDSKTLNLIEEYKHFKPPIPRSISYSEDT